MVGVSAGAREVALGSGWLLSGGDCVGGIAVVISVGAGATGTISGNLHARLIKMSNIVISVNGEWRFIDPPRQGSISIVHNQRIVRIEYTYIPYNFGNILVQDASNE